MNKAMVIGEITDLPKNDNVICYTGLIMIVTMYVARCYIHALAYQAFHPLRLCELVLAISEA